MKVKSLMNFKTSYLILFIYLCLVACADNQNRHEINEVGINEVFVTDIKPEGLKLFSYSVTKNMQNIGKGGVGGSIPDDRRGGVHRDMDDAKPDRPSMHDTMKEMIFQKLESKLAETGYCREGYIELGSYFGWEQSEIRGECKEGATAEDRKKFINKGNT